MQITISNKAAMKPVFIDPHGLHLDRQNCRVSGLLNVSANWKQTAERWSHKHELQNAYTSNNSQVIHERSTLSSDFLSTQETQILETQILESDIQGTQRNESKVIVLDCESFDSCLYYKVFDSTQCESIWVKHSDPSSFESLAARAVSDLRCIGNTWNRHLFNSPGCITDYTFNWCAEETSLDSTLSTRLKYANIPHTEAHLLVFDAALTSTNNLWFLVSLCVNSDTSETALRKKLSDDVNMYASERRTNQGTRGNHILCTGWITLSDHGKKDN